MIKKMRTKNKRCEIDFTVKIDNFTQFVKFLGVNFKNTFLHY